MSKLLTDRTAIEALQTGPFRKAAASGGDQGGGCVEVAAAGEEYVLLQDTKDRGAGAMLVRRAGFASLIENIKAGKLDDLA